MCRSVLADLAMLSDFNINCKKIYLRFASTTEVNNDDDDDDDDVSRCAEAAESSPSCGSMCESLQHGQQLRGAGHRSPSTTAASPSTAAPAGRLGRDRLDRHDRGG